MKSIAFALVPAAFGLALGCSKSAPATRRDASDGPNSAGNFKVDLAPARQLDMVFMLGNGACCGKLAKMNKMFPTLLTQLRDSTDGTYPDLRIAIIDSDLGTGGQYKQGSCAPNQTNGGSLWGDLGKFQMRGAASCGVTSDALWIEYANGQPVNYVNPANGDIAQVFGCLATNVGTTGCGVEQQLQAFEYALITPGIGNEEQRKMLRPYAQLALLFLADEDDCSATPDDSMFGDKPELAWESASLRCATRGHACGGVNLSQAPPGYPTTAAFSAPFASCQARMDACPNPSDGTASDVVDTSEPTECSPLKSVSFMANELKALKSIPDQQLLVAGIFGWPRIGADGTPDVASAIYRIDLAPNANTADTAHPQIFDYWPTCFDPDHMPKSSGYDAEAWGWGATGGLRLAAFVDRFGKSGLKFSSCERDYSGAMTAIGNTLAQRTRQSCLPAAVAGFSKCSAHLLAPDGVGGYLATPDPVPSCDANPTASPCYTLAADATACAAGELRVAVNPASAVATSTVLQLDCM